MIAIISIAVVMAAFCTCVYVINNVQIFKKNERAKKLCVTAALISIFGAIIAALVSTL